MASPFGLTRRLNCAHLRQLVAQQARRELAVAHVFSTGVRLAPALDDKQMLVRHCAEELEHFERAAALGDDSLTQDLTAPPAPSPSSWIEVVVAGYLLDQACYAQLCTYAASPNAVLRSLAHRLLGEERDHVDAGGAALRELVHRGDRAKIQVQIDAWLPRALASLDPPQHGSDPCGSPHADSETHRSTVETFLSNVKALLSPLGLDASIEAARNAKTLPS